MVKTELVELEQMENWKVNVIIKINQLNICVI